MSWAEEKTLEKFIRGQNYDILRSSTGIQKHYGMIPYHKVEKRIERSKSFSGTYNDGTQTENATIFTVDSPAWILGVYSTFVAKGSSSLQGNNTGINDTTIKVDNDILIKVRAKSVKSVDNTVSASAQLKHDLISIPAFPISVENVTAYFDAPFYVPSFSVIQDTSWYVYAGYSLTGTGMSSVVYILDDQ